MLNRIFSFYTKYLALWVFVFGLLAYVIPGPFIALKPGMDWFFFLTMFGIGAVLHWDDFVRIAKMPRIVVIGVIAQFTIMPLGAFFIAKVFHLPPAIALGLILTGSAPGAMASNVMTYVADADVAYSVSLTTVSTLLAPVLTPSLTYVLANSILEVDFWALLVSVLKMVVIPLILGFWFRHLMRSKIDNVIKIFPALSATFIVFICSIVIALNKDRLIEITGMALLAVLALNIAGLGLGYAVGHIARMGLKQRRTLCIEIGMQNAGLGTVLALKHFGPESALPTAAFVFICIFTAAFLAGWWSRQPHV